MRDDIRAYLRRQPERTARAAAFFEGVDEVADDIGDAILDAQIDAAERLDPSRAATSLFVVRLSGKTIVDGWVDQDTQDEILSPLTQEVEYAAPSAVRGEVRLGLIGVSSGSVLLHYRPRVAERPPKPGQLAYGVHPADSAILRVSELHDLLEQQASPAVISSAFKDDHALLRQTRKLVEALDKYSINLSTRWWGPDATRKKSELTRTGQAHGLRLFASAQIDDVVPLQGMVTAIDITGIVTVTGASNQNHKHKIDVGPDRLNDPAFRLGNQVFLRAHRVQDVDKVGVRQGHARYIFIEHIEKPRLDV